MQHPNSNQAWPIHYPLDDPLFSHSDVVNLRFALDDKGLGDKPFSAAEIAQSQVHNPDLGVQLCFQHRRRVQSMNIDDILAEAGTDAIIQQSQDLQDLSRAWVTERSAPEILPWPDSLMERVLERIHRQVEPIPVPKIHAVTDWLVSFIP